jgi:hypothetical protein
MSYTQLVSEVVPPSSDNSGSHQWYLDFAKPNVGTLGIPCISAATAVRDDLLTVGLELGEIRASATNRLDDGDAVRLNPFRRSGQRMQRDERVFQLPMPKPCRNYIRRARGSTV